MKARSVKIESAADGAATAAELAHSQLLAQPLTSTPLQRLWQKYHGQLEWLAVLLLTAGALVLRRKGLATQSLWFDEADLLARSQVSLGDILQSFTRPGENGPLYTLFMHFWTMVAGTGAAALRTPSMLAGIAAVPMLYLVGRKLYNAWFGLTAALLLAISPYNIWYSQDAKMYPLALLLTLTSLYLFLNALEKGYKNIWWWVAYVIITTASYYVHLMAVLVVPVEVLYYWLARVGQQQTPSARRRALFAFGLLTLPYLPIALWQVIALGAGSLGQTWFQPVGLLDMLNSLGRRFAVNRVLPAEPWESLGSFLFAGLALGGLIWLWWTGQNYRRLAVFLSLYLLLPIGAFYVLTTRIPLYADRYLLIASPAYYLLVSFALLKLWQARQVWAKLGGVAAAVAVLALVGVALRSYNYSSEPQKEDWRGAMQWLTQHVEPGDSVFVVPGYLNSAVDYYFKPKPGVDIFTLPSSLLDDHDDAATNAFLQNAIHNHNRAWLVVSPERYLHDEPKEFVQKVWFNYNALMFSDPASFVGVKIYGYSFEDIPGTNKEFYPRTSLSNYNFGDVLKLEGYDFVANGAGPNAGLPPGQVRVGDYLHLTFYWRKAANIDPHANYQITVRLLDANNQDTNTNYTAQPLNGYYPLSVWPANTAFRDFRDLYIHVPPGQYKLEVSASNVATPNQQLIINGSEGSQQKQGLSGIILTKNVTVLP